MAQPLQDSSNSQSNCHRQKARPSSLIVFNLSGIAAETIELLREEGKEVTEQREHQAKSINEINPAKTQNNLKEKEKSQ